MRRVFATSCVIAAVFCQADAPSAQTTSSSLIESSRQLFRDLIGINTAEPDGNTTVAATRVADYLKAAGFAAEDVQVIGADARRGNLVARLRGRGTGKPVLFLAHLDVVPAMREDWTTDPYTLVEKDGYFYGRGTTDDKQFCAIFAAAFAQLKRDGFVPDRDLVLALTTGEEQGTDEASNGMMWLLKHHRALIDAAYVINGDAGGGGIAPMAAILATACRPARSSTPTSRSRRRTTAAIARGPWRAIPSIGSHARCRGWRRCAANECGTGDAALSRLSARPSSRAGRPPICAPRPRDTAGPGRHGAACR